MRIRIRNPVCTINSYLYLVAGEEDEYAVWDGLADA
jgi:hypothetical protein